jgi:hypothetical protein
MTFGTGGMTRAAGTIGSVPFAHLRGERTEMTTRPRYWVQHLVEMLIAMAAGMFALAPVWSALVPGLAGRPATMTLTMALDMTIGMGAWMAIRGHDVRMISEMGVVMVAPFVVLLAPYGVGWLPGAWLIDVGHALMLVAMVALMLVRRHHYATVPTWAPIFRRSSRAEPADAA